MALLATNRSFRLLFSASAATNLGDGLAALAFPWLATLFTRDPMLIAFVAFAGRLPWFLFSIPAGVMTDRGDRKRLIIQADIFRVLLTLGVISMAFNVPAVPPDDGGVLAISVLAGLGFLLGTAEVLRDNAAQTLLPSIVDEADLERANGQMWSMEQVMGSFVGPPLAGLLIALAVPAPFAVEAIALALAIWLVWCIALPPREAVPRRNPFSEAHEAWGWMRAHPVILRLAVMLGLINLLGMMAVTMLILISQELLGLNATGHGLLLTAGAAGGVLGGLVGPMVVDRLGGTRAVWLSLLIFPMPFALIAVADAAWLVAFALFIEMIAAMLWNLTTVSYRQRHIPDALLGRVNSLYRFFGWGMMPIGALAGGWIVAMTEPTLGHELALRLPYALAALGGVLMAVYGFAKLRLN